MAVRSVAFSPDGSRIASGSDDETVRVWNAASGECVETLEGHSDDVRSVAFSLDGSRIASGSDDTTVRVWNRGIRGVRCDAGSFPLCDFGGIQPGREPHRIWESG